MNTKYKVKNVNKPKKDYLYLAYKGKEYLWLAFVIISVLLAIYCLIKNDREQALYFIVLTFIAGLLYSFNRSRRRKMDIRAKEEQAKL
jgi:L-asparagine transporter-like permease